MSNTQEDVSTDNGPVIVADDVHADDFEDTSSDRASSIASSTTSVASSILNHRVENGRTYHRYKDGSESPRNPWAADQTSQNKNTATQMTRGKMTDLQHNLFLLTTHYKLGLAPVAQEGSNVNRVLDVGTGTGLWCIEFGEDHPEAEVVGVDLSPVQTTLCNPCPVPPNVKFEVDDIEEPWTYQLPFDYIHTRIMTSSISDWKKFFQQCFKSLNPGGYIEMQEIHVRPECDDGTLKPDCAFLKWVEKVEEACNILGRPYINCDRFLPSLLKEVGFVDISVNKFKWPINPWPKDPYFRELGLWQYENCVEGIEAWTMAPFTRALNWTREEVNMFLIDVRKDMKDRGIHAYIPVYFIHARKPLQEEQ
ncbi:Methyltransferase domain-containing protein [Colletotrichum higginsianum IMI 349063]|uniref:Methyltransferase domain-containing protein n=1 Tax=Colletotrichum higginsianum (strain IMI 349063) TaxID=759273 RepID=A0A1B7XZA4_COLHI|nr:Methyltransferase domain-containing protein [Colletotrichum higginsianum IMI 349063]OBR05082.1 Methyltransferase domain-containing protein [Colletotrichum higginsianum IMI 349063]